MGWTSGKEMDKRHPASKEGELILEHPLAISV